MALSFYNILVFFQYVSASLYLIYFLEIIGFVTGGIVAIPYVFATIGVIGTNIFWGLGIRNYRKPSFTR